MKAIIDNATPSLSVALSAAEHAITRKKIKELQEKLKNADGKSAPEIYQKIQNLRLSLPRSERE